MVKCLLRRHGVAQVRYTPRVGERLLADELMRRYRRA